MYVRGRWALHAMRVHRTHEVKLWDTGREPAAGGGDDRVWYIDVANTKMIAACRGQRALEQSPKSIL